METTKIKVTSSEEEMKDIRQELAQWKAEEILEHLNFVQMFLDYENPENTRDGWLFLMFGNEELSRRHVAFLG